MGHNSPNTMGARKHGIKGSEMQRRFVQEYLIDLNATQAALRAGYSKRTAHGIGYNLLHNTPHVTEAIAKAMKERGERTQITADRVLEELGRIGFADQRKFTKWGESGVTLNDSDTLGEDGRVVAEVSETKSKDGGVKIKLHDKVKALELIGRHLGMWKDKVEHSGPDGEPLQVVVTRTVVRPNGDG